MGANELDENDSLAKQDHAQKSVLVPADIEHYPPVFEDTCVAILSLDLPRVLPFCAVRFVIPGLELLLTVRMLPPERDQCTFRNDPH